LRKTIDDVLQGCIGEVSEPLVNAGILPEVVKRFPERFERIGAGCESARVFCEFEEYPKLRISGTLSGVPSNLFLNRN
jgi:hypothetical protein